MTTTARTHDQLDNHERKITTTWGTSLTKDADPAKQVQISLETHHDKGRKELRTTIHTQTLEPSGFIVRSYMVMGPDSADRGLTIATVPLARFNQRAARESHATALAGLGATIEGLAAVRGVRANWDIAAAWAART